MVAEVHVVGMVLGIRAMAGLNVMGFGSPKEKTLVGMVAGTSVKGATLPGILEVGMTAAAVTELGVKVAAMARAAVTAVGMPPVGAEVRLVANIMAEMFVVWMIGKGVMQVGMNRGLYGEAMTSARMMTAELRTYAGNRVGILVPLTTVLAATVVSMPEGFKVTVGLDVVRTHEAPMYGLNVLGGVINVDGVGVGRRTEVGVHVAKKIVGMGEE